jgi:hypothetical protein
MDIKLSPATEAEIQAQAQRWVKLVDIPMTPAAWDTFKTWFIADRQHRITFLRLYAAARDEPPAPQSEGVDFGRR